MTGSSLSTGSYREEARFNVVRLCNKLDHFIRHGLSIEKDLERIRRAREAAAGS